MFMQQNDSHLVIRDVPIFHWVFGILFAGAGTLIITCEGLLIYGGIFAAVGVGFLLFSSILTITADRLTRTLKLDYRLAKRQLRRRRAIYYEISYGNGSRPVC
jgi:hypothetical protein